MDQCPELSSADIFEEDLYLSHIKIKMTKLSNISVAEFQTDLEVVVNYGKETLGRVQLKVNASKVEIDFTVVLTVNTRRHEELNGLTGTPIEFILFEVPSKKKKPSKSENLRVRGRSNLDLLPLILGELSLVDQRLLMESTEHDLGEVMVTRTEIPILYVDVEVDKRLSEKEIFSKNNVLFLTLESIYNLNPDFNGNFQYRACIEIPVTDKIFETVTFMDGSYTKEKIGENFKIWNGMSDSHGWNAKTKYRVSEDHHMIQDQTGHSINFKTLITENSPRITWNSLKRFYLSREAVDYLKRFILEKNYWPIEILVTKEDNLPDGKTKPKSQDSQIVMHLVSYIDLSMLIYPNSSRVRVASPIVNFDKEEYSLKSRSGQPFFDVETNPSIQKNKKGDEKKSKGSSKKTTPDSPSGAGIMVSDSKMFLVAELEFLYPIVDNPTKEFLYSRITELIPPCIELPMKLLSKKHAKESFRDCLIMLHDKLSEEYDNFMENKSYCAISESQLLTGLDLTREFKEYLLQKNVYSLLKETLKKHVTEIFRYKYALSERKTCFCEVTEETRNIYKYIVKKMHKILNSFVEGQRYSIFCEKYTELNMELYFGLEALEEDKFDTAKGWYLKRIDESENDAEVWIDYAIFLLRLDLIDEALSSLKKVLEINPMHCIGLLLYAAILTEKQFYDEARLFFQALTEKYDCQESWIAFNIYFTLTEDLVGQQNTLQRMGKSCHSSIRKYIREYPVLCWGDEKELASPYLEAVSLFLKINAFKFAEVALAKELARTQNPGSYSHGYYLAVLNYMRGSFEESAKCLSRIATSNAEKKELKILYGHVNYKLGKKRVALSAYKYVLDYLDCTADPHLILLRMGCIYLEDGLYDHALEAFANASASYPTPHSLLLAGIAAYKGGHHDLAESSLSESNKLDKYEAETWGYLALTNLVLKRREAHSFCLRQAKLLGMKNKDLEKEIMHLQKSFSNETI